MRSVLWRDVPRAVLFAVAYFAGSELGYALSLGPSVGGTFWPPAGISLAVFLASPARNWPLLLAGGILANYASDVLHGQIFQASIGFAIANLGEPLLGAYVLRRVFGSAITFARLPEMVGLAVVVVGLSAPLGAAIGALTAEYHTRNPPGFGAGWRTWWVGDAVGALVLAPAVFRLIKGWRGAPRIARGKWLEGAAFALSVVAVTLLVFSAQPTTIALPFLIFPVLLWGSVRLGPISLGGALCLVVILTARETAAGHGPLAAQHLSLGDRLIALQIYVGVMALSFYGLGALWEERAQTAAALKLAHSGLEARYRRIVEQSPLAILALKPGGLVQDVNPAWQRLWAHEPVEGMGGPPPWGQPAMMALLNRAFSGEVVELPEREILPRGDPDASPRRVRGFAYPIKDDAGVTEVVLIEQDITDEVVVRQQLVESNRTLREREEALSKALRDMEDAQTHRQKLLDAERFARSEAERASQLKDEFLATLSHELRTPLNAIVGWAHILRRSTTAAGTASAIDTIERNALSQARLIDDLLDMSRIMSGKVGLTVVTADLANVVNAAADAMQPAATAKGVALAVNLGGARGLCVSGDPARLQQVVANLLGNGIKFTPAGGLVEVALAGSTKVQLVVRDTGEGIHPDFLPLVFDRFRQADGSITRRHGGLGLGLSIAKQIVEMHGGSIVAHSDGPGQGATFTVTLPVAADAARSGCRPADEWDAAVSPLGLRVLVVDDEADSRELLRRLLVEQACEVTCASSAEEALDALGRRPFDVLLTDIGMPGTDGYELLTRMRAGARTAAKAIAVTAFARPEDRERALAAGFDGHVPKPVNPAQLLQILARVGLEILPG